MEPDITARLDVIEAKVDATFRSAEKMRKYFLITMWVTLATLLLPMIGLIFVIPTFLNYYSTLSGL